MTENKLLDLFHSLFEANNVIVKNVQKQIGKTGFLAKRKQEQKKAQKDSTRTKADVECHYCHKKGHIARDCFKKKRD